MSRRRLLTDGEFSALQGTLVMSVLLHNMIDLREDAKVGESEGTVFDAIAWVQDQRSNQLAYIRRSTRSFQPTTIYFEDSMERERFERVFSNTNP